MGRLDVIMSSERTQRTLERALGSDGVVFVTRAGVESAIAGAIVELMDEEQAAGPTGRSEQKAIGTVSVRTSEVPTWSEGDRFVISGTSYAVRRMLNQDAGRTLYEVQKMEVPKRERNLQREI